MSQAVFDKPRASAAGDTGSEGTASAYARSDHVHDRTNDTSDFSSISHLWRKDSFTLSGSTATLSLTFLPATQPSGNSLHLYCGSAVLVEGTDYTQSAQTVSILSAAGLASGDVVVARYAYNSSSTINDPRDISGLRLWLSSDAITGYTDDQQMTQWLDQSGNNFHGTAVGTTKPKYRTTAGPDSGPAVQFPNDGYFTFGDFMSGAAAGEIMATLRSGTGDQGLWGFGQDTNNNDESHYTFGGVVYEHFGLTTGNRQSFTPSIAVNTWRRYNVYAASGDWAASLDETVAVSTGTASVGWTATPVIGTGVKNSSIDTKYAGWIGGLVVYNRKLTTTERQNLALWMIANPSGGAP